MEGGVWLVMQRMWKEEGKRKRTERQIKRRCVSFPSPDDVCLRRLWGLKLQIEAGLMRKKFRVVGDDR